MAYNISLGDRNGVPTPMQWSADRNAGFSRANPQRLYLPINVDPEYHYETVNVEAQHNNATSLLWWMKRVIALRKRHRAFGRGSIEFLYPDNAKVLSFVRKWENETVLVVANLSRFVQAAEIDLSAYEGWTPTEMFGGSRFPRIGELPYFLTLGPHSFYWFNLEPGDEHEGAAAAVSVPSITVSGAWQDVLRGPARSQLATALARYIRTKRWFAGKARRLQSLEITDAIPMGRASGREARLVLTHAVYQQGDDETYVLPLGFADDETARLDDEHADAMIARVNAGGTRGIVYECIVDEEYRQSLLHAIGSPRKPKGERGEIVTSRTRAFRTALRTNGAEPTSALLRGEQSNTSVVYDERFMLKLYRKPEFGRNPELEIGEYLTEVRKFGNAPALAGAIEYRRPRGEPMTLMVLQEYVRNQGDAWSQALDALGSYFEHVVALPDDADPLAETPRSLVERIDRDIPEQVHDAIGPYVQAAEQLGRRTAELHNALAADDERNTFKPERFTPMYQRSLYQSMRGLVGRTMRLLNDNARKLPEPARSQAVDVATHEDDVLKRMREPMHHKISAMRIRRHGDYHLGQVLHTGNDFVIIDFEGEPARPLTERRLKRSPLTDVAGLLRSFDYATNAALRDFLQRTSFRPEQAETLRRWADAWYDWCSAVFLRSYIGTIEPRLIPATREHLGVLLDAYLLDKAVYELNYELNNRPEWVEIPLHGILRLLGEDPS
jgi:maltose alpha-D-glucosyltransferase/alpha-amylase